MTQGPLEWCIEIAIIVAVFTAIVLVAHAGLVAMDHRTLDHRVQRPPADRTACAQRPSNHFGIIALR